MQAPSTAVFRRNPLAIRQETMHDQAFDHEHLSDSAREEMARYIWSQESLEMTTVGIDIGSSTSHLLFAKILLQRRSQDLSSRFVVVKRDIVWRSPIILTPFLADDTIDAAALGSFIQRCYAEACLERSDVDSGAVILTGDAIKRKNAQAIDELFAGEAGKFVCATAGHRLECMLAAHGSGAVKLSRERGLCLLHVDIGGGTTKVALIDKGRVLGVSAFAAGGRLLASDANGSWTRIEDSARLVAAELGIHADPRTFADEDARKKVARRLAEIITDYITDAPLDELGAKLRLTEPLPRGATPDAVSFSGGVSEYLFGRETKDFGDIARYLAGELRAQFATRLKVPAIDPGQGIRATVIGASQFTVQVSGKTIYLPDRSVLPVHNLPVVRIALDGLDEIGPDGLRERIVGAIQRIDLTPESRMAIAFAWHGSPEYHGLAFVGRAIIRSVTKDGRRKELLLLMIDGDVGKTIGHLLQDELGYSGHLVSIDGVQLQELDFVDVGEFVDPPGVVPVVIKSLLFS